ncbi:MAG: hypothetical protein PHD32_00665 [Eubacteriales bacterium]|nr:hypothetical protein [Eubacteriales bacterium]
MQEDIITRIRQAEQEAAALREQGQAQARDLTRAASQQAEEAQATSARALRQEVKTMQAQAFDRAQTQAADDVAAHARALQQDDPAAREREDQAVRAVLERIVKG